MDVEMKFDACLEWMKYDLRLVGKMGFMAYQPLLVI